MQYIQYYKINPNRHLFEISFGKKKLSIKQRLRVSGDIFAPNPIFSKGISSVALLGGGQPDFAPPPH